MHVTESAIFVVDDDEAIVDLTTAVLNGAGFTAFGTTDPEEAIRIIETDPSIKLVLSDLMMPRVTGPELVRRALRVRNGTVRVLFMSGGFDGVPFRNTDRLLEKPLSIEKLTTEVRRTLAELPVVTSWEGPERRRSPQP